MPGMKGKRFVTSYRGSGWAIVGALGTTLVLSAACGGETSQGSHQSPPVAHGDFSRTLAYAFCEGIAGCCDRYGYSSDTATCKTTLEAQFSAVFSARFSSPNFRYDANAAAACTDAFRKGTEACTDRDAMEAIDDTCENVFQGQVKLGGACGSSTECVQNATGTVSCDTGICTVDTENSYPDELPHGSLGDPCHTTCFATGAGSSGCSIGPNSDSPNADYECWANEGFICGSGNTCVAAPTLGQSCDSYCTGGAYCNNGSCVAQIATGSCENYSAACLSTSYCDYDANLCTPKKADGETCNGDDECVGGDCYNDRCRVWAVATAESCSGLLD